MGPGSVRNSSLGRDDIEFADPVFMQCQAVEAAARAKLCSARAAAAAC
jgi:hypothetical protein